jgi:hypothetical protein
MAPLVGLGAGICVALVTAFIGAVVPELAPAAGLAIVGLPVALISGWTFAPIVVGAPRRWLPPLVIGLGIATAFSAGWA